MSSIYGSLKHIAEETNGHTLFDLSLKSTKRFGNADSMQTFNIRLKPDLKINYNNDIDQNLEAVFDEAIKRTKPLNTIRVSEASSFWKLPNHWSP